MPFVEVGASGYLFGGLLSCVAFLGTLVIKQDRGRIKDLEEKQEEDGNLLHEINGKIDVIIHTLNGGKKDKG